MTKSAIIEDSMQENLLSDRASGPVPENRQVYRLSFGNAGKIPAFKVGTQWRFKRSMVEAWLESNMNTGWRDKSSN